MDLAAAFYISVYTLAALAGAILAWAEYTPSVSVVTAPLAIALLFLNERHRVVRLDGFWIGLAGLAAFAFPAFEFWTGDEEYRLLSGAHLMAILQWVLLAYNKTAHQYWWICALSCLQVAVAAVLTNSPIFGIFILIYMFWALWTLSLYTLLLARLRFTRESLPPSWGSLWQWPALTRDRVEPALIPGTTNSAIPDSSGRGPSLSQVSEFRGTFQCEPHETDLNWRFVIGIIGMSAVALVFGLILFLLTPRVWIGAVNPLQDDLAGGLGRSRSTTGFSETVRLSDFGKILESSAPVMEVKLFDDKTNDPLPLADALRDLGQDEALLRGAALAIYDRGQWLPAGNRLTSVDVPRGPSPLNPQSIPLIRQEIYLQQVGSTTLFTLGHAVHLKVNNSETRAKSQFHTQTIYVPPPSATILTRGTSYTAWSPKRADRPVHSRLFHNKLPEIYSKRPDELPVLIQETQRVLAPLKQSLAGKPATPTQIAQTLVAYLRDSQEFQYSLDRTVVDPNLDPIEDFLINRKQGHCQYFAAALGLMLRVEGIPTCVITGFKGGIEDPDRQILEIQQRHAHAWVEAFIDKTWVTLDATPPDGREDSVEAVGDRLRLWHQMTAFGAMLWNDYVLNLSFSRQQQDLYGPIQNLWQSVSGQSKEGTGFWKNLAQSIGEFLSHPDKWFSWQGGLVAFVFMIIAVVGYRILSRMISVVRRMVGATSDSRQHHFRVELHQRFMRLIKPLGLVLAANQTQREFAAQVSSDWERLQLPPKLLPVAEKVAHLFDRMRFGSPTSVAPLSKTEQQEISDALDQLEEHLQNSTTKLD